MIVDASLMIASAANDVNTIRMGDVDMNGRACKENSQVMKQRTDYPDVNGPKKK